MTEKLTVTHTSGHGLLWRSTLAFAWRKWVKTQKPQLCKLRFEIGTYKAECYHVVMVFSHDSFISVCTNNVINIAALLIHICEVMQTHYADLDLQWYSFFPYKFWDIKLGHAWFLHIFSNSLFTNHHIVI